MSRPVNQTKTPYAYYGTANRHRGYGRRRLFLVRPRPGRPARAFEGQVDTFSHESCSIFWLPDGGQYLFYDEVPNYAIMVFDAVDRWQAFNTLVWQLKFADSSDWVNPGPVGHWYKMSGIAPEPFFSTNTDFTWT